MFNKFFNFLKGYVIIKITGSDTERFINICIRRGIDIRCIKYSADGGFILNISIKDFFALKPVAYKTKTKIKIIQRCGVFEFKKHHRHRYAFAGGIIFIVLFFIVMSQFIWVVQIKGVYDTDINNIIQILEQNGIKPGSLKRSIPPISDIKYALINGTENISWAWVYIDGARAEVEIYEKRLKPQIIDKSQPCNISAVSDAFIINMNVLNGERMVENGTSVSAGDVLISGVVPIFKEGYEEKYMNVHAAGSIEAVTYHKKEKLQQLFYESRIKTGREKSYFSLEIFGKVFNLFRDDIPDFEEYDFENSRHELNLPYFGYSGICLNKKQCFEVEVSCEPLTEETAAAIAQNELEEEIAAELSSNPQLLDKELEWEKVNNDTIRVNLKMTFLEDIGTETTINEE